MCGIELTVESGAATLGSMHLRPPRQTASPADQDAIKPVASTPVVVPPTPAAAAALGSLADLPVAGLTRRRIGFLIGALVAAWILILFARQVGEASAASSRAEVMRASNTALQSEVAALARELDLIQHTAYIEQQARTYRLGTAREIPFALADDAPPLALDAPGMPAVRLGAVSGRPSPLESWLDLLFGVRRAPAG